MHVDLRGTVNDVLHGLVREDLLLLTTAVRLHQRRGRWLAVLAPLPVCTAWCPSPLYAVFAIWVGWYHHESRAWFEGVAAQATP